MAETRWLAKSKIRSLLTFYREDLQTSDLKQSEVLEQTQLLLQLGILLRLHHWPLEGIMEAAKKRGNGGRKQPLSIRTSGII